MPPADPTNDIADLLRGLVAVTQAAANPPLLLCAAEAAAFTGQSRASFYRGVSSGAIPSPVATPSGPRWRRADLARWVEKLRPRKARLRVVKEVGHGAVVEEVTG